MTPSARMQRLVRIAERDEREAAARLREARHAVDRNLELLHRFLAYREEYARGLAPGSSATNPVRVADTHRFIAGIEQSIAGLQAEHASLTASSEQAAQAWQAAARRTRNTEAIAEQRRADDACARDEQRQNELDDLFNRGVGAAM